MIDSGVEGSRSYRSLRFAVTVPLAGYVIFISESLFARPSLIWALLLLLWALIAAVLAAWLTSARAQYVLDWFDRNATRVAIVIMLVAALVFLAISSLQSHLFALSAHAEDTAYYSQVLWNTLHGSFLAGNVQQERLYTPPVTSDLALHVSPVLLVVFLPIYALFPHFLTLLFIRDLALAAAAWPLFLIARDSVGGTAGVMAVTLYLANPAVVAQSAEAFYLLQLAPLPFFFAFRYFIREDLGKFLLWICIALCIREDVAITLVGFGLWGLLRRRRIQWWGLSFVIPIAWWGISTLLIQPAFGRLGNSAFDRALSGGDQNPLGSYSILLGSPSWFLDALRNDGLDYVYRLLRSVAFLGALGWEGLLAGPAIAANLFLSRVFYSGSDPFSRFALLPSCALIGASVVIVNRMGRRHRWDLRVLAVLALFLLPSVSVFDGLKDAAQARFGSYTVRNDAAALWQAVKRIPNDASVAAPNYALPALANRPKLFYLQYLHMYPQPRVDYFLLDRNFARISSNPELRARYIELFETLSHSTDYETVWQQGEYCLLERRANSRIAG
jgi:Predicted membrane protein (DUF2079)